MATNPKLIIPKFGIQNNTRYGENLKFYCS